MGLDELEDEVVINSVSTTATMILLLSSFSVIRGAMGLIPMPEDGLTLALVLHLSYHAIEAVGYLILGLVSKKGSKLAMKLAAIYMTVVLIGHLADSLIAGAMMATVLYSVIRGGMLFMVIVGITCHRELLSQSRRVDIGIYPLPQPFFTNPHY